MNYLLEYIPDKQQGRLAEEWLKADTMHSSAMENILTALKDAEQAKQVRRHILSLCSQKNEEFAAFCERLLDTYLMFYVSMAIDNKIEPKLNKWSNKLYGELINRLG